MSGIWSGTANIRFTLVAQSASFTIWKVTWVLVLFSSSSKNQRPLKSVF